MLTHTLIPEANSYGIAILVIYCLSSFSLAAHLHLRWLASRAVNFLAVYCAVMGFTSAWGFMIFGAGPIFGFSATTWMISLPLGLLIGRIAGWSDRTIVRYAARRQLATENRSTKQTRTSNKHDYQKSYRLGRMSHFPVAGTLAKRHTRGLSGVQLALQYSAKDQPFELSSLVLVAILEELIHRGFLLKACFLLPDNFLIVLALMGSIGLFSLSHLQFGWAHVLAKLPLGILATLAVLLLGTVLPAIVAHVTFNIRVWVDRRNQPVFVGST